MEKPPITEEVRAYQKWIAYKGGKSLTRTARSLAAKRTAQHRWRLRKARYGETGRTFYPGWIKRENPAYRTTSEPSTVAAELPAPI